MSSSNIVENPEKLLRHIEDRYLKDPELWEQAPWKRAIGTIWSRRTLLMSSGMAVLLTSIGHQVMFDMPGYFHAVYSILLSGYVALFVAVVVRDARYYKAQKDSLEDTYRRSMEEAREILLHPSRLAKRRAKRDELLRDFDRQLGVESAPVLCEPCEGNHEHIVAFDGTVLGCKPQDGK